MQYLKGKKNYILFQDYLNTYDYEPKNLFDFPKPLNFNTYCISIFNHWLTKDEYTDNNLITHYSGFISQVKNMNDTSCILKFCKTYYDIESSFLFFYMILFKNFQIFFFDLDKKLFYKTKLEEYTQLCIDSIREKKFIDLFIPELKTVIVGNYDFTPVVYYKGENNFLKLKKYVDEASLYILK